MPNLRQAEAEVIRDLRPHVRIINGALVLDGADIAAGERVVCTGTMVIRPDGSQEWESISSIWAESDEQRSLDIAAIYSSEHGEFL